MIHGYEVQIDKARHLGKWKWQETKSSTDSPIKSARKLSRLKDYLIIWNKQTQHFQINCSYTRLTSTLTEKVFSVTPYQMIQKFCLDYLLPRVLPPLLRISVHGFHMQNLNETCTLCISSINCNIKTQSSKLTTSTKQIRLHHRPIFFKANYFPNRWGNINYFETVLCSIFVVWFKSITVI